MPVAARTAEKPPALRLERLYDDRFELGIERLDDDRLAVAVRREGERAFELLYERLHGPLYGYCCGMLGDGTEAEEALQETMIRAYATLRKGEAELRIKPWLYTVARNVCIDRIRQRRALPLEINEEDHDLLAPSAADSYEQRERLEMLVTDMYRLSERQRSALILRELSGLSLTEIGDILATTPDRAKALISEARRSLRRSRAVLAAGLPLLPTPQSQTILANVLASGGAAKAGAGTGSLLAAVTAKKLAGVAALVAIGAGTAGVAVRTDFGAGNLTVASSSAPAAAAAAFALGPGAASAVSERPAPGTAPGSGPVDRTGTGGGQLGGGGGPSGGSPGSGTTPGTTSPSGGSLTGDAQNTVNGLLGNAQQTVDQTVNQVQGTLNDTVRDLTGGVRDKTKGVTDGLGVRTPRLGDGGKGILGK